MPSTFLRPFYSVIAVVLALLSASSFAANVTYTSPVTFLANVAPGAYTQNFNGLGNNPTPTVFSGGGFSYTVSAPGDLYASGDFLGTNFPYEELRIDFTSDNVYAVGANFYASIYGDAFAAGEMNISLSNGTSLSFTPISELDGSYGGFTSDVAISWLKLTVANVDTDSLYAGLDNLTVGTRATIENNVPEPTSLALAGLALAGLLVSRRQRVN